MMLLRSSDEWLQALEQVGVPAGPINSVKEVFDDPQILARNMKVTLSHPLNETLQVAGNPINLSRTPITYDTPPPLLGEHAEELLWPA
jgi:crotonobetainyl-CoA:carnitine CoA-transferase CaiB-like acyl-CoA transferase